MGVAWGGTYSRRRTDVYATTSRDGGRSFRAPVRVNRVAGEASFSGEQPPRIAVVPRSGSDPSIVVSVDCEILNWHALVLARSNDGGLSFAVPKPVPGSEAAGNRGWESVATSEGRCRCSVAGPSRGASANRRCPENGAHQHGAAGQNAVDGVARAQLSRLFFATWTSLTVASARWRCLLLLQDIDRGRRRRLDLRRVAARIPREHPRHRFHDVGRRRTHIRVAGPRQRGQLGPRRLPREWTGADVDVRTRSTSSGRRWSGLHTLPVNSSMTLFYARSLDGHRFSPKQRIPTGRFPSPSSDSHRLEGEIIVAWDEQLKKACAEFDWLEDRSTVRVPHGLHPKRMQSSKSACPCTGSRHLS